MSVDAPWRDEHCGTNPTSLAHFCQKLLAKNVRRPDDVMWPQMTFQREMMQQRAGDIKHSLSDYDSRWVGQIRCILEVLRGRSPICDPSRFATSHLQGNWWGIKVQITRQKVRHIRFVRPNPFSSSHVSGGRHQATEHEKCNFLTWNAYFHR